MSQFAAQDPVDVLRIRRLGAYEHEAPSTTVRGDASLAHWSLHTESPEHDSEHAPVHCTVHVEPPLQSTLPLEPTTRSHSDPPSHVTLHD